MFGISLAVLKSKHQIGAVVVICYKVSHRFNPQMFGCRMSNCGNNKLSEKNLSDSSASEPDLIEAHRKHDQYRLNEECGCQQILSLYLYSYQRDASGTDALGQS